MHELSPGAQPRLLWQQHDAQLNRFAAITDLVGKKAPKYAHPTR
jgi:hypothetical protein